MISISVVSPTRVLIVNEPPLVARLLYGRKARTDLAIRADGYWKYQPNGGWVGMQIEAEIDDALVALDTAT